MPRSSITQPGKNNGLPVIMDRGIGHDHATAIAVDSSGNVYVTGKSRDGAGLIMPRSSTIRPVKNNGLLATTDRIYSDEAHAIALDGSGNVYVTGKSYRWIRYVDYATIKYNSTGQEQWVARYDGPANCHDDAKAIAIDGSGNVYVTGSSIGIDGYHDYATIKYNSAGRNNGLLAMSAQRVTTDEATAIAVDGSGNIYVTGYSHGRQYDYATIKYNSAGQRQWVARYNGPGNFNDQPSPLPLTAQAMSM